MSNSVVVIVLSIESRGHGASKNDIEQSIRDRVFEQGEFRIRRTRVVAPPHFRTTCECINMVVHTIITVNGDVRTVACRRLVDAKGGGVIEDELGELEVYSLFCDEVASKLLHRFCENPWCR